MMAGRLSLTLTVTPKTEVLLVQHPVVWHTLQSSTNFMGAGLSLQLTTTASEAITTS